MTGLRELFEDAAGSPARPSGLLTANEVYDAGRRRHRRRRAATTVAGAAALTLVTVAAVNLLAPVPPSVDGPPLDGPATPTGNPDPATGSRIRWAGAADRDHLYLALSHCADEPCRKQTVAVVRSSDGGRTWSDRGAPIAPDALTVVGPDTLITTAPDARSAAGTALLASLDGGRTWAAAPSTGTAEAVPDGGVAICWSARADQPCVLHAVDPTTGGVGRLAAQPPLNRRTDELRIEESAGRLRIAGTDPTTRKPAVSTSTDAGRTWSTHVFTDAPACPEQRCEPPMLAVTGTATAYAVVSVDGLRTVYRADGTRWQRLTTAGLPDGLAGTGSFVTADGTHVLTQLLNGRDGDVRRYWAARDGDAYRAVELDGLPKSAEAVRRAPDGWFYAPDADGTLYGSTDGWRWSPVTHR
ncbi:hypothetical protein Q3W71_27780 [Micromonospora sp. C28SCA-DRY-2]|uniref:sialidase family protein n=1 Tax=Micromonospora sp. C28SCA-DRY-2 TaxID=3059522 RepID=UPI00267626F7|nr:hypothetical protein [Micromonospora sp. C28SCA-DRY-2]MDO3705476.1 hypothetical protein [Micromonospora sp. C28SCA-DRY-2]